MRLYSILFCIFFSLFIAPSARAALDCGDEVIIEANGTFSKKKIENLCGKPTEIKNWKDERFIKTVPGEFVKVTTHYSRWTYNQGSNKLIAYLLFEEDMLIEMKDGDYGSD